MKRRLFATLCAVVAAWIATSANGQDMREWTARDGGFSVVGKLDVKRVADSSNTAREIYILDDEGRELKCPLDKLSDVDQLYLARVYQTLATGADASAIEWIRDEKREAGTRRALDVDGVEYAFRWVRHGRAVEPSEEYDPNTLKAVAAAQAGRKSKNVKRYAVDSGFWMLETEVTLEMYNAFIKASKYKGTKSTARRLAYVAEPAREAGVKPVEGANWRNPGFTQTKTHPVTLVTLQDAQVFCAWLTKKIKKPVTLPTRAQWLLASQPETSPTADFVGALGRWIYGADDSWERGNLPDANFAVTCPIHNGTMSRINFTYRDSYRFTTPVGIFNPNVNGLYDMIGNVGEWALDSEDPIESLGGSWFHIQNFNPLNWKRVDGYAQEMLREGTPLAASRVEAKYAQNYEAADAGFGNKAYVYSPMGDVDATCFTGFRVIIAQ